MEAEEAEEEMQYEEDTYEGEVEIIVPPGQDAEPEEYLPLEVKREEPQPFEKNGSLQKLVVIQGEENRSGFIHGLSVGLGIGCISTFLVMWITVYFSPQLPSTVTYETLLSIFIYPLVYLLSVGLIALTAGVALEYYTRRSSHPR